MCVWKDGVGPFKKELYDLQMPSWWTEFSVVTNLGSDCGSVGRAVASKSVDVIHEMWILGQKFRH